MSIEILEAAIARLELLSQDAAPRPWVLEPDHYVHDLTVVLTEHEYESHQDRILVCDYMHKDTAPLVLALSRTVDPILDMLRFARGMSGAQIKGEQAAATVALAVCLARAILGEVEQ